MLLFGTTDTMEPNPNLIVVIDVQFIKYAKNEKHARLQQGWTMMPVFVKDDLYVKTGLFQLPLFEGAPNNEILDQLRSTHLDDLLPELLAKKTLRYQGYSSIFIRTADGRRHEEVEFSREVARHTYLPFNNQKKYLTTQKGPSILSLIPKKSKFSDEEFEKKMVDIFVKSTNWPQPQ